MEFIYITIGERCFSIRKDILVSVHSIDRGEVICTFAPIDKDSDTFRVTYYLSNQNEVDIFMSYFS